MPEKSKILVVDDEADLRNFIVEMLDPHSYDLIALPSGEDTLIYLEQDHDIDLILLDIMMPGLDGFEVLEMLKANPKTQAIKVIMLTAMNRVEEKVKAFTAGACDFVVKPFEKAELIARLETQIKLKRAEQKIQEAETRYRTLVEQLPAVTYLVEFGAINTTTYISPQVQTLLGFSAQEWLTDRDLWHKQIHPDDRARVMAEVRAKDSQGESLHLEYRVLAKDGRVIWFRNQSTLIRDQNNQPRYSLGVMYDITERKAAEQAVWESEERYRALAEQVSDLISRLAPTGEYTYVSPACRTLLGFTPQEMLGRSFFDFIHPDDLTEVQGMNPPLLDPASAPVFTLRFRQQNGNYIWLESSVRSVPNSDTTSSEVVAVARDVTERKRYEDALQKAYDELERRVEERTKELSKTNTLLKNEIDKRSQIEAILVKERATLARRVEERTAELSAVNAELARASRLKDEFLTSMSHELRTPLNAILGISEAMQEQVYGSLDEAQLQALRNIEESGRHLLALINDILDLSKIEAGKLQLEISPVNLEDLCQASLRFIKQTAHSKRIRLSSTFAPCIPETIRADERRLKQILVNLLSNAVKFTPEGGSIGLEVLGDEEGAAVHLTIWDTGIGIPAEQIPALFKPFVQLDSSLSRRYAGTGLGLVLVQRMVEMHGGSITLASQIGQGSRFTVSLPIQAAEDPALSLESDQLPDDAGFQNIRRALIVEDSAVVADQYTRYLNEWGIETIVCLDGVGAADKALEVEPQVIILDVLLPGLHGWDILTQLKANSRTKDIPVLVASVLDERPYGLALGATEYLTKPISRQQLQQTLARLSSNQTIQKALVVTPATETAALEKNDAVTGSSPSPLILLAEDNKANINVLSDYLLNKGFQIIVARNGHEAITRARESKPDLILMDIQMPEMNGLQAIDSLRSDPPPGLTSIPIIALTALAMPGDRERCLAAGANDYMSKPVSLKGLMAAIETQLNLTNTKIE